MKNPLTHRTSLLLSAVALVVTGGILYAGPLDPPAGPVTSTYKTIGEIEPRVAINAANTPGDADSLYKITAAGSYYLTGNFTGVAGKSGIEIALPAGGRVILDLSGFTMQGVAGSLDGVSFFNEPNNLCFQAKNGTIRGWGGNGVVSSGNTAAIGLADLAILLNSGWGVVTPGELTMRNCRVNRNIQGGVDADGDVDLSDLAILHNGGPALIPDGTPSLRNVRIVADGLTNSAPLVSLNGGGVVDGLSINVSNSTFTGPVLRGNGGSIDSANHEQSPSLIATNVSAAALAENFPIGNIRATNCTLSTAVVNLTDDGLTLFLGDVTTAGTTTAPSLVRMVGSTCMLKADRLTNGNPLAIGMVLVDISGSANSVSVTTIATVASGNTLIRLAGALANGNTIEDCQLVGSGTGPYTGIQLSSNNNLVRRNEAVRLLGGTFIDNQGSNNAVGPVVTAANILTSNNPNANTAH